MKKSPPEKVFSFDYSHTEDAASLWLSIVRWAPFSPAFLLAFSHNRIMVMIRDASSLSPSKTQQVEFYSTRDVEFLPSNLNCNPVCNTPDICILGGKELGVTMYNWSTNTFAKQILFPFPSCTSYKYFKASTQHRIIPCNCESANLLTLNETEAKLWNVKTNPSISFSGLNAQCNNSTENRQLTCFDVEHNVLLVMDTSKNELCFYRIKEQKGREMPVIYGMVLAGKRKLEGTKGVVQMCMKIEEGGENVLSCCVFVKEARRIVVFKTELEEQPVVINKAKAILFIIKEMSDAEEEEEKVSVEIPSSPKRKKVEAKILDSAEVTEKFEKLSKLYMNQSAKLDSAVILCIKW